jgi:hypothetical protein
LEYQARGPDPGADNADMSQGVIAKYGLKRPPECVMNKGESERRGFRNKYKPAFEARHNPA